MNFSWKLTKQNGSRSSVSGVSSRTRIFLYVSVRATRGDAACTNKWCIRCMSEDVWFRTMLGIDVGAPPLPTLETRLEFVKRYAEDCGKRLAALREKEDAWWEDETSFFDVRRSRTWVMIRRLNHTSHHRGQQLAMLRMLGRNLHSNYGPTADTGGLMQSHAPTIYAYPSLEALLQGESAGGAKSKVPGPPPGKPATERPGEK